MDTNIPTKPNFQDKATNDRAETTALRRRMLEGNWYNDLEDYVASILPNDRMALWGTNLDQSSNVFKSGCRALAALYNEAPFVGVPRKDIERSKDFISQDGALDRSGLWPIMQSLQMKVIGLREMALRIDLSDSSELLFRPVTPDMIYASAPAGDPMKPNYLYEYRLRRNNKTMETFWTADIYDLRNPSKPTYDIRKVELNGDFSDYLTQEFLGGDQSGDNYPYRDSMNKPFLPWTIYHASLNGSSLFSPYELSEVVSGSLQAAYFYSAFSALLKDSSWPQRWVSSLQLAGTNTHDTNQNSVRMSISADPTSILCFASDPDSSAQPMIGQFEAGMKDPNQMIEAITVYERRLAASMGIDPASVSKISSDPRSGYSIAMSREAIRQVQRMYAEVFRRGDIETLEKAAKISNRFLGTNYPEENYRIEYQSVPLSSAEQKERRENVISLLEKNLISPVDAIQTLFPNISSEEDALAKLRQIRQQRIEFS